MLLRFCSIFDVKAKIRTFPTSTTPKGTIGISGLLWSFRIRKSSLEPSRHRWESNSPVALCVWVAMTRQSLQRWLANLQKHCNNMNVSHFSINSDNVKEVIKLGNFAKVYFAILGLGTFIAFLPKSTHIKVRLSIK